VEEGRELFWESYQSGKVFAQRQSFWDAFFVILDSRDRDWLGMLLSLLFRVSLGCVERGKMGRGGAPWCLLPAVVALLAATPPAAVPVLLCGCLCPDARAPCCPLSVVPLPVPAALPGFQASRLPGPEALPNTTARAPVHLPPCSYCPALT